MMLLFLAPVAFIVPVVAMDIAAVTLVTIGVAVILDSVVTVVLTIVGATTDSSIAVGGFVTVLFWNSLHLCMCNV